MKHKAHIAHQTHGRTRMKIPAGKGNQALLDQVRQALSVVPGIEKIVTNAETGSVVLHYDPNRQAEFDSALNRHVEHGRASAESAESAHAASHAEARVGDEIDEMLHRIESEAEFLAAHSESAKALVEFCKDLDRKIKLTTHNTVDLKIVLAATLTAITIFEIGVHAATPMWVTLALFGLHHFAELHHPPHIAHQAAIGRSLPA